MQMQVVHGLATVSTCVHHHAIASLKAVATRDLCRCSHEMAD
jgi:hypothetical protein